MPKPTAPEVLDRILDLRTSGASMPAIAQAERIGLSTVHDLLSRHEPVANELRSLKRDHLLGGWQWLYFDTLAELQDAKLAGRLSFKDRRDAAITLGIATEKALLLAGQPTQIVAGVHIVGSDLPELAGRLAAVAQAFARR